MTGFTKNVASGGTYTVGDSVEALHAAAHASRNA